MFVLPVEQSLFAGKYALRADPIRGGYWAIYKNGVCYVKPPRYNFQWFKMSDEDFKESYPTHYKCFKYHEFLFGAENDKVDTNKESNGPVVHNEKSQ